jgi:hypothetical protein
MSGVVADRAVVTPWNAMVGTDGSVPPSTLRLKPSRATRKPSGYVPPLPITSVISSLPQVFLAPTKLRRPSGQGSSTFGPGMLAT